MPPLRTSRSLSVLTRLRAFAATERDPLSASQLSNDFHNHRVTSDLALTFQISDHGRGRDARVNPNRRALSYSFQRT